MMKALSRFVTVMTAGISLFAADRVAAQMAAPAAPPKIVTVKNVYGLESNARLRTPVYTVNGGSKIIRSSSSGIREWVQTIAEFYTVSDVKSRWLNQVTFQFYVLTAIDSKETKPGEPKQKEYTLFRGSIAYQDVDRSQRQAHWAAMFLRPSVIPRYGDPVAVAVEVTVDGQIVDAKSEVDRRFDTIGREKEWWKNPKLVVKDGYLLKPDATPFAFINYDDFEETAQ